MSGDPPPATMPPPLVGHDAAERQLRGAADSGRLHHGWILAGPRGLGKASFARRAAHWLLSPPGQEQSTASLIRAGSHPDLKWLARLPKEPPKEGEPPPTDDADLRRNISVDQVRALQPLLSSRPALSDRRVIVIDAIDDLEREGANALLKNLEEPPTGTIFLCVSHAPDRLLPTLRSRCQILRFEPLSDGDMRAALARIDPDMAPGEIDALTCVGGGAPGQALAFAGLDMAELDRMMAAIADSGDRDNRLRSELARLLSLKAADARYHAFLRRVPAFIAMRARTTPPRHLDAVVRAWQAAEALAQRAPRTTMDKSAVVLDMSALLASLQAHKEGATPVR